VKRTSSEVNRDQAEAVMELLGLKGYLKMTSYMEPLIRKEKMQRSHRGEHRMGRNSKGRSQESITKAISNRR
jgi:hypothetical protein